MDEPGAAAKSHRPAWLYGSEGDDTLIDEFRAWTRDEQRRRQRKESFKAWLIPAIFIVVLILLLLVRSQASAQSSLPWPAPDKQDTAADLAQYAIAMTVILDCSRGGTIESRPMLVNRLFGQYAETHADTVYVMPTAVAELYLNRRTGTWTIIRTGPQKQACMVAAGQFAFRPFEQRL